GAHAAWAPELGPGPRQVIGADGRVLFAMPAGSVDELLVDLVEADGLVYFGVHDVETNTTEVSRVAASGGPVEPVTSVADIGAFELSPDGTKLAVVGGPRAAALVVHDLAADTDHRIEVTGSSQFDTVRLEDLRWDAAGTHLSIAFASTTAWVDCRTG